MRVRTDVIRSLTMTLIAVVELASAIGAGPAPAETLPSLTPDGVVPPC
jgi:hypothetical protein